MKLKNLLIITSFKCINPRNHLIQKFKIQFFFEAGWVFYLFLFMKQVNKPDNISNNNNNNEHLYFENLRTYLQQNNRQDITIT